MKVMMGSKADYLMNPGVADYTKYIVNPLLVFS